MRLIRCALAIILVFTFSSCSAQSTETAVVTEDFTVTTIVKEESDDEVETDDEDENNYDNYKPLSEKHKPKFPEYEAKVPEEYLIEDFPALLQSPELPTGCEITAMTMVLNYYGFDVDKLTMALEYLPTIPELELYEIDGITYGPDLESYFVGDPTTSGGYICGTTAIVTAANEYLSDVGSDLNAVDMTGTNPEELYKLVSEGTPVVVWVTISMKERYISGGWYTENGIYVDWATNDHGAVFVGYTADTVTIADPISGIVEYSREDFEAVFESRGCRCVIIG